MLTDVADNLWFLPEQRMILRMLPNQNITQSKKITLPDGGVFAFKFILPVYWEIF
jgi:hypothetical protein